MSRLNALFASFAIMFGGCQSLSPETEKLAYYYGGFKVAQEVIEEDPDNREVVQFVADAIDVILMEDEILFATIEAWYAEEREKVDMDPIDKMLLEQLVIDPLWDKLKKKYGGVALKLDDPHIKILMRNFQTGLRQALEG